MGSRLQVSAHNTTILYAEGFQYLVTHALLRFLANDTWIDDLRKAKYIEKLTGFCRDTNELGKATRCQGIYVMKRISKTTKKTLDHHCLS